MFVYLCFLYSFDLTFFSVHQYCLVLSAEIICLVTQTVFLACVFRSSALTFPVCLEALCLYIFCVYVQALCILLACVCLEVDSQPSPALASLPTRSSGNEAVVSLCIVGGSLCTYSLPLKFADFLLSFYRFTLHVYCNAPSLSPLPACKGEGLDLKGSC